MNAQIMIRAAQLLPLGFRRGSLLPALSQPVPELARPFRTTTVQMGRRSAKIANRKGKADAKKAKIYGRIGKKIIQLVKAGGPDPVANSKLSDLLKQAKELGVPKDVIERNLKKASDAKQGDFQECIYEAYGPGGTGFVIEALTDNVNRSAGDIKSAITKGGGKPADSGSVMFNFMRQGQVLVIGADEDELFEAAIDAGADDVQPIFDEDGVSTNDFKLYTQVEAFAAAISKLQELGFKVNTEESELVYRGTAEVAVDEEAFAKCEALMDRLLELDDVDSVYTNCEGLTL